jgi:hypothetical protein
MEQILGKRFEPKQLMDNPSEESLRAWALEHRASGRGHWNIAGL